METKRTALVTGVSRETGLGFEVARQLSSEGLKVIISARDLKKVVELALILQNEGLDVVPLVLDILDDLSAENAYREIENRFGRLDVLINNAGGFYDQGGTPLTQTFTYTRQAFDTNLFGAWRLVKVFLPLLEKSANGIIVNVSSGAGAFEDPGFGLMATGDTTAYGISKLALNGLTVKLAAELKDRGIKVNAVCPGFTATYPGTEQWGARPVAEGAGGIVWAATLPKDGPTGGFFRDGKPLPW
ncbi:MAG: SDR family NAD(P)-dependent oxidoreductase [Bacteroidetes bacterium]|nr:SDR family NAD(P)-dependent oxidoreductase [Bacteroidota bacterium]